MAKTKDDDAIPQEMADSAMSNQDEEWEEVRAGIGRGWDFSKDGKSLTGLYMGTQSVELPNDPDRETANAHQFGLLDGSGEIVFLWESHELNGALEEVGLNEKIRVTFLGYEPFTSKDGPRQVKRYRVQRAVRK